MSDAKTITISIPTVAAVKTLVAIANKHCCKAYIKTEEYTVDAKSIMGVFSLDVTKPVELYLEIGSNKVDDRDDFIEAIDEYIVK